MGNRAHVIFTDGETISPAIYLHWNGGPESVYAFLDELDARHVRADAHYEVARFAQIVGDFFDQEGDQPKRSGLSLGITNGPSRIQPSYLAPYEHGDNGVYVVQRHGIRKVRRFKSHGYGVEAPAYEWTAAEVEEERLAAYLNERAHGIRAFFDKTRGEVE